MADRRAFESKIMGSRITNTSDICGLSSSLAPCLICRPSGLRRPASETPNRFLQTSQSSSDPDELHDVGPAEKGEEVRKEGMLFVAEREGIEEIDVGRSGVADGYDAECTVWHAYGSAFAIED